MASKKKKNRAGAAGRNSDSSSADSGNDIQKTSSSMSSSTASIGTGSTNASSVTNGISAAKMLNPPPNTDGHCTHCHTPTKKLCGGCENAPSHPDDDGNGNGNSAVATETFYCEASCLKADWGRHKSTCTKLQSRKALRQAAKTLQTAFLRIRQQAYPVAVNRVEMAADEGAIIHTGHTDDTGAATSLHALSDDLFGASMKLRQQVLSHAAGADAVVCLYELARELFSGLCSSLEEVTVCPATAVRTVRTTSHDSPHIFLPETKTDDKKLPLHCVYRLTLKQDKTVWAVDITGAQHGFPDPLCPWPTYVRDRCREADGGSVHGEYELGYFCKQWKDREETKESVSHNLFDEIEDCLRETAEALGGRLDRLCKPGNGDELQVALRSLEAAAGCARVAVEERAETSEDDEEDEDEEPENDATTLDGARLDRIAQLEASLDSAASSMRIVATPLACLREARELLMLLQKDEEGEKDDGDDDYDKGNADLDHGIPLALLPYLHAFQVAVANSDEARAQVFAQRAHMRRGAAKPAEHPLYGRTRAWRQGIADIPVGLGPDDFEAWLWREDGAGGGGGMGSGMQGAVRV